MIFVFFGLSTLVEYKLREGQGLVCPPFSSIQPQDLAQAWGRVGGQ